MQCKSILSAYSGDIAKGSGLRHAINLAKHHNAHLTGVLRHGTASLQSKFGAHIPQVVMDNLIAADAEHGADVRARFDQMIAESGLSGQAEFVDLDPLKDGPLTEFAHTFDLIVTGVPTDFTTEAHLAAHPDMLALKSGRPILAVPDGFTSEGLADRAIVAWDGKRSAARALGDAMDILAEKSHVTLLSVGQAPRGTQRMVENMKRHGVSVDARTVGSAGSIAAQILKAGADDGAKLIVMGAFEHSKFSHDLFGGVTTDILAQTQVPVFMAH